MTTKILQPTALFFAALFFLSSCNSKKEETVTAELEPKTETFLLQKEKLTTELRLPAELTGFQQVDLYAKVSSFVKLLKVDIGTKVKKGQLLIVLEAPEISSQLAAAESRLRSMEAIYTTSKSTYNRLYETSKVEGTISKNDLEMASGKKNSDYAQYQAAVAAHKEVKTMRGYLEIRAPFDGVVASRNVNLGAFVGPSSSSPLLTIQQQDKLRLAVSIPELYTGYLHQGDEMSFNVKSLPETFKAKITRMSGALDLKLRSERVEMDVINTKKDLLPGMVAEVLLPLNAKDSTFVIPKTALVSSAEGLYVIKVLNKKATRIDVKKGREIDEKIEIFGDLNPQDKLVKIASEEIKEGDAVNE
ncbi:efflux RND transporter periplasmic adaptor subunit [Flavobacterium sp. GA093]|uniref:Efflux RND transporter periplasmic adaptor subunit n=1 Tax=Flavobacterium hydrocarbonoxydans TaxID=2683249 RepID=A0A6I4NNP8_9FLAO|nr:efflux RND transporter periplasmic adaptor subunit [Flavobacterium hydrocarbonoxydans]MWB92814.1 efflux RND transporter periplasmic adaptor subunit [Flavobacterium hydrocarbonoxydans]